MDTMITPTIPVTADSSLEEKAAFGARELDEKRRGWFREINLETLNMREEFNCIVGQLAETFENCREEFGWDLEAADLRGLYIDCHPDEYIDCICSGYTKLDQYWTIEILNRRIAEQESV